MSTKKIDNVIEVTSYLLKRFGVKYTHNYLSRNLQTHPFYPSLAAVSDIFANYNIVTEAHKISYEILLKQSTPFIAHLAMDGGTFIVVEKITDSEVIFYFGGDRLKSLKKEDFIQAWDNIIFLARPTAISIEPDYVKNRRKEQLKKAKTPAMGALVLFSFLCLVLIKPSIINLIPLFIAKITGLFFAVLLVKQEMGYHSEIADKLCTLTKSAGCNEVLRSKASKLFGNVFLADVGFIWFMSSFLYLLLVSIIGTEIPALTLLGWFAAGSVPFILFSIIYQIFVLKKYCPLCLGVMIVLLIEVLLMPVIYGFRFQLPQISEILMMFIILGITTFIWFELKRLLIKNRRLKYSEINYLRLKRNPSVIMAQLTESAEIDLEKLPNPIRLTDNNSDIVLTEVINLYCNPCKRAFEKIKKLLEHSVENGIDVQVILLSNPDEPEDIITKTALHLTALAEQHPINYVRAALFDWFEQLDYHLWSEKHPATVNDNHLTLLKNHATWFEENELDGTPVSFFNRKKMPLIIDLADLQYLIN